MVFFKVINKAPGLKRLFIGGVHGNEGLTTIKPLKKIYDNDVKNGTLTIYNFESSPYLSTLNPDYYQSLMGEKILDIIKTLKPEMYIELHCYNTKNYHKLTDKKRLKRIGVPPLIELEEGVLIGSVSPQIRTSIFKKEDICITLELPCKPSKKALTIYTDFLKVFANARNRSELEETAGHLYPEQVETSKKYAHIIFGEYPPF